MTGPCSRYTPETCPCNVHSAARARAREAAATAAAVPPVGAVKPLEDGPESWEYVEVKAPKDRIPTAALYRLAVPGGWLYAHWVGDHCGPLTFVPHPL